MQKLYNVQTKKVQKLYNEYSRHQTPLHILLLRLFALNVWFSVSSLIQHLPPHCPKGEDY